MATPGTLTACIDSAYPPLEYYKNGVDGEIVGIDADGIRALGKLWDVNVKLENQAFEGLVPALQTGRCDLLWSGLYMNEEREQTLDGVAYMVTGPALAVRPANEGKYTEKLDLCGGHFGVQSGGAIAGMLKKLSDNCTAKDKAPVKVSQYPQPNDIIASVVNGKLDGIVETDIALQLMVEKTKGLAYIEGIFPAETKFGVFTNKGSKLSQPVSEGVKKLIENGEMGKILENYKIPASRLATSD
ncbi:transporter substrate-binding domain-containing protein [Streptomyces sp. NPDC052042]|uniref:transporter substrate-binding domain-containing protein n=1 Tax=Streptomyces sp. NPDC052042 TaxID=3365683 RepID=UPI0037D017B9